MDRSIPVFNKLIISQTQKKNHQSHLRRLHSIRYGQSRAMTSLRNPESSVRYSDYNPKRELMEEERRTQIQKQNILLYNKMSKILNRTKTKSELPNGLQFRDSKLRELNKINQENRDIIKRLENQKPTISNKRLYEEHVKKQKLLKFMGTYPYKQKFKDNQSPLFNHSMSVEGRKTMKTPTSRQSRMSRLERKFQRMEESFNRTQYDLPAVKQTKEFTSKQGYEGEPYQSIGLYRKNIVIEEEVYQVVITRLHHQYQFKLYDQNSFCYQLLLPELQGNKILTDYDYDFAFISSCLRIKNNKLCLNIDKEREIPDCHRIESPEQRMLVNESKQKSFKLQPETVEKDPEIVLGVQQEKQPFEDGERNDES